MDRAESALERGGGKRLTDEQIFDLLRAGEAEGGGTTALCEAYGVTVPTYCVWKARYGKLTLEELRRARTIESRRTLTRHVLMAVGTVAMLAILGLSIGAWVSPSEMTIVSGPAAAASREVAPAAISPSAGAAVAPPPAAADPPPPTEGYSVQLAAVPDVQEASGRIEQLRAAGYSAAYLLPTTAGDLTLYRVRIGPFDSLRDAQDVVRRLKRDGYEGTWISK